MATPTPHVRGDDDVRALLDTMAGGGPSLSATDPRPLRRALGDDNALVATSAERDESGCGSPARRLAVALGPGPPGGPRVEVVRHRHHEKFKARFYDLVRSVASPPAASGGGEGATPSSGLREAIRAVWRGMPPHSVWERFQFSLKALEGECVRELQQHCYRDAFDEEDGRGFKEVAGAPPWCAPRSSGLLRQLVLPEVRQTLAWTVAGRDSGTVWEPLLPVGTIAMSENAGEIQQKVNREYRQGTMALLREEVEFQFRRTFKQQKSSWTKPRHKGKEGRAVSLSLEQLFSFCRELEEASTRADSNKQSSPNRDDAKNTDEASKRGKKKPQVDSSIDKEEYILQTIFHSSLFRKMIQKLHKKFRHTAEESYSSFLSELRKTANRLTVEKQSRLASRRKQRGKVGGGSVPKITSVENNDDSSGGQPELQLAVTFAGISLRINATHEKKLRAAYRATVAALLGGEVSQESLGLYPTALFTLLLRHHTLEGAGLQAAIPSAVFRLLRARFDCCHECFASPLNHWTGVGAGSYGSVFGDTDASFGSAGSFFHLDVGMMVTEGRGGCFQANPPFATKFIERMCRQMELFLSISDVSDAKADNKGGCGVPLMFVVFVPAWSNSAGWKALSSSPYMRRHVQLSQKDDLHYYAEGTQHRRGAANGSGGYRIASFDTSVFFLQSDAAQEQWPLRDEDEDALKTSFATCGTDNVDEEGWGSRSGQTRRQQSRSPGQNDAQSQLPQRIPWEPTATAKHRKKRKQPNGTAGSVTKKKKLMKGGQDEMNILASIGMFD